MIKKVSILTIFMFLFGTAMFGATAELQTVTTSPNGSVSVDINVTGFTQVGAITFKINLDPTSLTFVNATNLATTGFLVSCPPGSSVLSVVWTASDPLWYFNFTDGRLLTLNFTNTCISTTMNWNTSQCEVADKYFNIIPVTYTNGGVNVKSKISGLLTYDNDIPLGGVILDGVTVYIKDGPEPVPPLTGPVPNILYTTTTNGSGYFEVYVPNGTYYIYAASSKAWAGVDNGDVTNLKRYINNLSNTINSPIRFLSADVSMDGAIDGTDVTAIRRRINNLTPNPNFVSQDWIFQNPSVIINCADMPNQNFTGLCAGDVNGTYPN